MHYRCIDVLYLWLSIIRYEQLIPLSLEKIYTHLGYFLLIVYISPDLYSIFSHLISTYMIFCMNICTLSKVFWNALSTHLVVEGLSQYWAGGYDVMINIYHQEDSIDSDFCFNIILQINYWPTCLRLPVPVPNMYSAHPGTSRMEERASIQPNTSAQVGYMYQLLKVRGLYHTSEHIKAPWE